MTREGRAAPPAAGEHVATRVTLNHALGNLGGKRKSWMTSQEPPSLGASNPPIDAPKKRGRPPNHPVEQTAEQQPQARQPPVGQAVWEQPLSNSASPQLANVLSHPPNGHPLPSRTTVLPSPSPSEDANIEYPTPPATAAGPSDRRQSASNGPSRGGNLTFVAHDVVQNAPPADRFMAGARQVAAAPNEPTAGAGPMLANNRTRPSVAVQGRPISPPLRTQDANVSQLDIGRRVSTGQVQTASPTVNQPFSPALRQTNSQSPYQPVFQQHAVSQRATSHPHIQLHNGPAPVQSPLGTPTEPPSLVQNARVNNSTAQTPPSMSAETQTFCLQELQRFISSNNYDPNPHRTDFKRIKALELAAQDGDWHYLITHLFYCVLTLDKAALPEAMSNSPHAHSTEQFLGEVLEPNHMLTPAVKDFFTQFPLSPQTMHQRDPRQFQTDLGHFTDLMSRSGTYYTLKSQCDERNFPPLMHELVYDLGIRSKHLQRIVFTATIRRLWNRWELGQEFNDRMLQFESTAMRYFSAMQATFYSDIHSGNDVHAERNTEMHRWIDLLKGLRPSYVPAAQHTSQERQANAEAPVVPSQHTPERAQHPQQPMHIPPWHVNQSRFVVPFAYSDPRMPPHPAQAARHTGRGRPRGRPRLATHQPRPQPQLQVHSSPQPLPIRRSILPARGYITPQQHQPNPARFALHQAHLRSASLQSESGERLYLYAQSFLRRPQPLTDVGHKVERWCFTISPEQMGRVPKDVAGMMGSPPIRNVDEKSFLPRLRCVKWSATKPPDEHSWATSDTSWIPYSYFTLNGKSLEQRKKLHYGKDLPIDLTSLVKEGENVLEIAIVGAREDKRYRDYLVAIEALSVTPHQPLLNAIQKRNHVPAATIKQRIKDKLSSNANDDDDEIAIVNTSLNITLFDPFIGSKMCDIPVRSRACDHFDCFDLVTYLETRKRDGGASVPDHWKCPVCNGDARPQHLIVDGFLQEVRSELDKQGLLNTRAIIMSEDGSWKPKLEVPEGVADCDDDDVPARRERAAKDTAPRPVEVIELGDSDNE